MRPCILTLGMAALVAGCASTPPGVAMLLEQPAERALLSGLRAYDDALYPNAEKDVQSALDSGLKHPRDRALAHKLLAFMQCSSQRLTSCEQSFVAARLADPAFVLNKAEIGHPLWGPVYRRLAATP